jgi:hypothetical protein
MDVCCYLLITYIVDPCMPESQLIFANCTLLKELHTCIVVNPSKINCVEFFGCSLAKQYKV